MKTFRASEEMTDWLSPDEQRLLNLYRDADDQERIEWLYRVTRRRLRHMFAEDFDDERDACDTSYLYEELEQWLREICPKHLLGEYLGENPDFRSLIDTAWDGAARVVLGPAARDGQCADALLKAVRGVSVQQLTLLTTVDRECGVMSRRARPMRALASAGVHRMFSRGREREPIIVDEGSQ